MPGKRLTPGNVQEVGRGLYGLAKELELLDVGEKWTITPGSPSAGTLWTLSASAPPDRVWVPEWLLRSRGVLGKTITEARDTLMIARDVLEWVRHSHPDWDHEELLDETD